MGGGAHSPAMPQPVPPTVRDHDVLARTLWAEARGELRGGRVAVGCVIRNRVNLDLHGDNKPDWWGEGYAGVCLVPSQFSCWNANDPNRAKLLAVTDSDPVFAECEAIARHIIAGRLPDVTLGATHYHNASLDYPKGWGKPEHRPIIQIGRHLFYNLVE